MIEALEVPIKKKNIAGEAKATSGKTFNPERWALDTAKSLNISSNEAHQAAVVFKEACALFEKDLQARRTGLRILARAVRSNDFAQKKEVTKSEAETKELGRECLKLAEILRVRGIDFPESISQEVMTEAARKLVGELPESERSGTKTYEFSIDAVPKLVTDAVADFAQDGQGGRRSFLVLFTLGSIIAVIAAASGKCSLPSGGTEMVPVSDKTPESREATPQMISIEALIEIDRDGFSKDLRYYADYSEEVISTEENAGYETFLVSYGLLPEDFYWLRTNPKAGDREIKAYVESKIKQISGRRIFSPQERAELRDKYQK